MTEKGNELKAIISDFVIVRSSHDSNANHVRLGYSFLSHPLRPCQSSPHATRTEDSDDPVAPPAASRQLKPVKNKWGGEDEEESAPASDWEESSEEESEEESKPAPVAAPPKKKGTLKAKLAEKEAEKASRAARDDDDVRVRRGRRPRSA
ncbi:hypothetical protein JVU11DRAFT_4143 [Chiua virens]|nr:hypothetical protein JVU11DRAFT_4143 [Chiua virens]